MNPEIILGPPGCGKTTALLAVAAEEMGRGVSPDRIGFLTFTRRAATEAQDRAAAQFGLSRKDLPFFRTIHSLCMRWLGASTAQIMDGERLREFADHIGVRITGRFSMEDGTFNGYGEGDRMLFMSNLARVRRIPLRQLYEISHDNIEWRAMERFDAALQVYKREQELLDYTDLLEQFVARGTGPALEVLIVDEGQDLSMLQWDVIHSLAITPRRVVVAGDDDQNLFYFAGSSAETLIDLPGQVRVLGQSYRVPQKVQVLANEIISRVKRRRPKEWAPRAEPGRVQFLRYLRDVDWTGDSILFLARNRYQLEPIAAELRSSGILYEREGNSSVRASLLSAIVTWERLRRGEPQLALNVQKVYEHMSVNKGVRHGQKKLPAFSDDQLVTLDELETSGGLLTRAIWHDAMDKISVEERVYLMRCRRRGELLSKRPRVRLSTIHGSKGGEADRVILMTDMAARTHAEYLQRPDDEHRVFYVGATRARQELTVLAPATNLAYTI